MSKLTKDVETPEAVAVAELDGIEMGVLPDGTAFLTGRGIARLCGVAPRLINSWANEYDPANPKPRDLAILGALPEELREQPLYVKARHKGRDVNAFSERVSMAVLEYYAFDAREQSEQALDGYRMLARAGLRAFVYSALGYTPRVPPAFQAFHDRTSLNKPPKGYFSIFRETSEMVLDAIRAGLRYDEHTVPDGSVGTCWAAHWRDEELEAVHGPRKLHPHDFPGYYPQAAAEVEAWVYPLTALPAFRTWLDEVYLPEKYPAYLSRKVKQGALPAGRADLLIAAMNPCPGDA